MLLSTTSETLTLPSFTGTINTPFRAPGGLSVQIPASEISNQIATLTQQPGMGYLNELAARRDVEWHHVKLAHDQWNYKQEGLTPAGAALLAAAVAWAMPAGAGANLLGTKGATTSAMANAAFASLATTTAVNVGAEGMVSWARNDSASEAMSNMLLSAAGTPVGFKVGDLTKGQMAKFTDSFSATMKSKPTGFLTIEGPNSRSVVPNSIGSGVRSITGEKIAACNQDGQDGHHDGEFVPAVGSVQAVDDALRDACIVPSSSACTTMTRQVLQRRQEQLNLYMSHQLPAMYVAGANMQGTGELIVKQATSRCDVSIGCSSGQVWETGVTTLQLHKGNPPDEQP